MQMKKSLMFALTFCTAMACDNAEDGMNTEVLADFQGQSCGPNAELGLTAEGDVVEGLAPGCDVLREGECSAVFVSSEPGVGFTDNYTWSLGVTGPCTRVVAEATMPDHGHGTLPAEVEGMVRDGVVVLSPLNLYMGGIWKIEFSFFEGDRLVESTSVFIAVEG